MNPKTFEDADRDLTEAFETEDPERIAAAVARMDSLEASLRKQPPSLHSAALWYAEQGMCVFPLSPGTKIPFKGTRGCKDATDDIDRVNAWWAETPDANVGLATGRHVDIVDIDGAPGQLSRARHWDAIFGRIDADAVAKVLTPRPGGMHVYVPATGDGNSAGIVPGVDYRGLGGYVLAPPSVITEEAAQRYDNHHPGTYRFVGVPRFADLGSVAA